MKFKYEPAKIKLFGHSSIVAQINKLHTMLITENEIVVAFWTCTLSWSIFV